MLYEFVLFDLLSVFCVLRRVDSCEKVVNVKFICVKSNRYIRTA